jgi:YHS domain-containing protein
VRLPATRIELFDDDMKMKALLLTPVAVFTVLIAGCSKESSGDATAQLCPVTGEKLGSMGDPCVLTHEGKEVKLCCEGCKEDFLKDPAKYLAKIAK